MDIRKIKECPDCASRNIVHSEIRDQIICRDCGLVYEPLTKVAGLAFEKAHKVTVRAIPKGRELRRKPRKKATRKKAKKTRKKTTKKKTVKKKAKKSTKTRKKTRRR